MVLPDHLVQVLAEHELSSYSPIHWHDKPSSFVATATHYSWSIFCWATNIPQITSI